ncbi:MAG: tetratricopeptide repeat protein [Polyangiaceae bacterium]
MSLLLRLSLLAALATVWGCHGHEVVRVVDGVEIPGRYVADTAYAAYGLGAEWEARGRDEDALRAFVRVIEEDPKSVEAMTRAAAILCRLDEPARADRLFAAAEDRDADYEPLWRRRAECAERRGDAEAAVGFARRAVAADPERVATVLLLVAALRASGEADEAWAWLSELTQSSPHDLAVWRAVAETKEPSLVAWRREAAARTAALEERQGADPPPPGPWDRVDAALLAGDLAGARVAARSAHLDLRRLAARALALGRPTLAVEEARLRVGADPRDADARAALALGLVLVGQAEEAVGVAAAMPEDAELLSPAGRLLVGELLLRMSGVEAASAWLGGQVGRGEASVDALRQRALAAIEEEP